MSSHSVVLWYNVDKTFWMVEDVKEATAENSCSKSVKVYSIKYFLVCTIRKGNSRVGRQSREEARVMQQKGKRCLLVCVCLCP